MGVFLRLTSPPSPFLSVIFVVLPATDDFGAHESLKIAREFDPEGQRTLGVVTKMDRAEPGSDIISKLKGMGHGHIKLKLGFVAVRNRTPQEVRDDISIEAARDKERAFFEADARFSKGTWGIPELITRVSLWSRLKSSTHTHTHTQMFKFTKSCCCTAMRYSFAVIWIPHHLHDHLHLSSTSDDMT